MKVIFFADFAHPLRSLWLNFFTAKDAEIYAKYAKKNVRLLPGEGIGFVGLGIAKRSGNKKTKFIWDCERSLCIALDSKSKDLYPSPR